MINVTHLQDSFLAACNSIDLKFLNQKPSLVLSISLATHQFYVGFNFRELRMPLLQHKEPLKIPIENAFIGVYYADDE